MSTNTKSRLYQLLAMTVTIVAIAYSGWLFGELDSNWRYGTTWQSNIVSKLQITNELFPPAAGRSFSRNWAGLIPYTTAGKLALIVWPILVGASGVMWWKCSQIAEQKFSNAYRAAAIVVMTSVALALLAVAEISVVSEKMNVRWGVFLVSEYDRIRTPEVLQVSKFLIRASDWTLLMSLVLGAITLVSAQIPSFRRFNNTTVLLSAAALLAYLGAYVVSLGGTTTAIIASIIIAAIWILALVRVILDLPPSNVSS